MTEKKQLKIKAHFGKVAAIMIAVFAVLLALDLILKHFAFRDNWSFTVIPNLIWVKEERNYGAAFSFLADTSWGRVFLIVLTFILLAAIIFVFIILPERFVVLKLVLAMMAAGALGNLIDRLAFGYVRDFVYLNMFFSSPCCNFADFWVVIGAVIGVIDALFLDEFAVIPLTKKAKAAAKLRSENEEAEKTDKTEEGETRSEQAPDVQDTERDDPPGGENE